LIKIYNVCNFNYSKQETKAIFRFYTFFCPELIYNTSLMDLWINRYDFTKIYAFLPFFSKTANRNSFLTQGLASLRG
jgi:hypothetical protein